MQELVQEYYGRILERSEDSKTNACCTAEPLPQGDVVEACARGLPSRLRVSRLLLLDEE